MTSSPLLLTFYGDDLTGSTDAMEVLAWGGVRTVLFLEPPKPEFLYEHFADVQAVGVAGVSRSMTPAEMDDTLPEAFLALKELGAPAIHYKVCSTFDSSPSIGSIGHAIDIGVETLGEQLVPVVIGAPFLKRYVAFSNLFARVDDTTYRLDRHPTMSRHPITPMQEADLRLHLAMQTGRQITNIHVHHLAEPLDVIGRKLETLQSNGAGVVVFDTLNEDHLQVIGALLQSQFDHRDGSQSSFVVGSSGVERALVLYWQSSGVIIETPPTPSAGKVEQIIVVSGSAAPGNAIQMQCAETSGFASIRMDSVRLVDPLTADVERQRVVNDGLGALAQGRSAIIYSAYGPDDPNIAATNARLIELGLDPHAVSRILGSQQGLILRDLLERTSIHRVVIAGGDTCGYAARQLGIYALSPLAPIAPGAPLCVAHASLAQYDGLQIALKGGQIGQPDYFDRMCRGGV